MNLLQGVTQSANENNLLIFFLADLELLTLSIQCGTVYWEVVIIITTIKIEANYDFLNSKIL